MFLTHRNMSKSGSPMPSESHVLPVAARRFQKKVAGLPETRGRVMTVVWRFRCCRERLGSLSIGEAVTNLEFSQFVETAFQWRSRSLGAGFVFPRGAGKPHMSRTKALFIV